MTYRKEQTRITLYHDNVILGRSGKKMNWRCILSTFNYDVPERINSINAISWQRYTSMYQKNKVNRRCIVTT